MDYYFSKTVLAPFDEAIAKATAIENDSLGDVAKQVKNTLRRIIEAP